MPTLRVYRSEKGTPWLFPVVRKIEKLMADDPNLNHEYLNNFGLNTFTEAAVKLLLGKTSKQIVNGQAFGIQTLGGTGSLYIGLRFLRTKLNQNVIYVSQPTWDNHVYLAEITGFEHIREYRYWDAENRCLDFEGMCEDLSNAPENAVVLLHACCHNPTATDPNEQQWTKLSKIMKEKKLFPFFDCAYQGLASGDVEKDAWAVRHFANEGHELFCAQSLSKIFGIYNERTANLTVIVKDKEKIALVKSNFPFLIRSIYLSPPYHGACIVATALTNPDHYKEWLDCVRTMYNRSVDVRKEFRKRLEAGTEKGAWKHVTDQVGMFCYSGLSINAVKILKYRHHIYMLEDGRISINTLNEKNLNYVVDAIVNTLEELKIN